MADNLTTPPPVPNENPEEQAAQRDAAVGTGTATVATERANVALATNNQTVFDQQMRERNAQSRRARDGEIRRLQLMLGDSFNPDEHLTWVQSNRRDDRVVLFEQDPLHPGGEAFVAGSAPEHVYHTPAVDRLLREGLLIEVPEPMDGPKKPLSLAAVNVDLYAAQPGQPIPLGRPLDPDLYPPEVRDQAKREQENLPDEIPVPRDVVVPEQPAPERNTNRDRRR
jgi:hypothetical protein